MHIQSQSVMSTEPNSNKTPTVKSSHPKDVPQSKVIETHDSDDDSTVTSVDSENEKVSASNGDGGIDSAAPFSRLVELDSRPVRISNSFLKSVLRGKISISTEFFTCTPQMVTNCIDNPRSFSIKSFELA